MNGFSTPKKSAVSCRSIAAALEPHDNAARPDPIFVSVPWEQSFGRDKLAVLLPRLLSGGECKSIIETCENYGFEPALFNSELELSARKSGRCVVDDVAFAETIYQRVRAVMPKMLAMVGPNNDVDSLWKVVGLNERLRVLKYEPGDYFHPHSDGCYQRTQTAPVNGEQGDLSFFTLMLYLNDAEEGGETNFTISERGEKISYPCLQGQGLAFEHRMRHESALLKNGVKYAIRTDVMYRRVPRNSSHYEAQLDDETYRVLRCW